MRTLGIGYCAPTEGPGDCESDTLGSWKASRLREDSLEGCAARCARCAACGYVSYSPARHNNDCSWFSFCAVPLQLTHGGRKYQTVLVKNASLPKDALASVGDVRAYTAADRRAATIVGERFPSRRHQWRIGETPHADPPPSECGEQSTYRPVSSPDKVLVSDDDVVFRHNRGDLVEPMRTAVSKLAAEGSFAANSHCVVFGSCSFNPMRRLSLHSTNFRPCQEQLSLVLAASGAFNGIAGATLPASVGKNDDHVFCHLASHVRKLMQRSVLPHLGVPRSRCVVQEMFINVQKTGAFTNPHVHPDDFFGGIFYIDAPRGTRLCYDNSTGMKSKGLPKERWAAHAPQMARSVRGGAGYTEPAEGDIVLAPVSWLRHWVPPITEPGVTRTAAVFNMICL